MRQFLAIKNRVGDALLLYRMGDFYETFGQDAVDASRILGITLTQRGNGAAEKVPLAGFPHHQLERYLPKIVNAGRKVAICEQTEDPSQAKGIVRRDITEIVSRGTTLSDACLDERSDNLLAALLPAEKGEPWGLAFLDLTTGRFESQEGPKETILGQLETSQPVEVVWPEHLERVPEELSALEGSWSVSPGFFPGLPAAHRGLNEHFGTVSLEGFGWTSEEPALRAAAAALRYGGDEGRRALSHVRGLWPAGAGGHLQMDGATLRNLEILRPMHDDDRGASLAGLLDRCRTSMGSRNLRRWLARPLLDLSLIGQRQQAVETFRASSSALQKIRQELAAIPDLERLCGKIATQRAHARDLVAAARGLLAASVVEAELALLTDPFLAQRRPLLQGLTRLANPILETLVEAPPLSLREGGLVRPGTDAMIVELESGAAEGRTALAALQQAERDRTGISTLKVGYNRVFGYYLEITKTHADRIPPEYQRIQTLTGAERYTTPDMKRWEEQVLGADEKIREREYQIFCQLRDDLGRELPRIQALSQALAEIDTLAAFAHLADESRWVRPEFHEGTRLDLRGLRHPVLENLHPDTPFVANDVLLDTEGPQIQLVTGPNMGGKSTYLRMTGLAVVMAHAGCPVPCDRASIPLVDRVFTRVGAGDRLSRGQSTFLVEMIETANILHNATPRSLVLLDEVGRGTSTFDGLSLAWAIAESLHENPAIAAKTMFATHYHELTVLAERLPRLENLQVLVREHEGRIVFLHRVVPGACDGSYGLHVARMAGVPEAVLDRAKATLLQLEAQELQIGKRNAPPRPEPKMQLSLFSADPSLEEVAEQLRQAEPVRMTPMEALVFVQKLKDKLG
ncbi:MAG: DNA mismatch repair protein MutS [Fibrobacterota bacterium]|nr:MAG: DNA mismatch repair protein MutS [Fibrobacterota bacterium]